MSLTLNFLGGAPFQLLYDGVREAINTTRKFRTQLINLEFTLDCLQPQIIQQIRNNNVQLSLPDDIIQDLQVQMNEGIELVARLSKLSMWNIRIWGNCCNCIKPNYAEQLEDLDRSLKRLLELLKLEQIRNITLLMLRIDEIERRQSDILHALQDIPGYISRAQQEVIQRMQVNAAQQVRNGGGGAAPAPVLGVVFGMLYDAVIQVKVKNLMFKRLLGEFKHSLDCLKPLIEEVANNNKVLHLPMLELEDFVIEMEKAVGFVHKCSNVSKLANYRKYPWTNKLLTLDKCLQKLFIDFKGQVEGKVKEAIELVSNIEAVMNQTKGSLVENDDIETEVRSLLPQPDSPSARLELQDVLGTSNHVIKKTLIDTARITEEGVKPSQEVTPGFSSLHTKNALTPMPPQVQTIILPVPAQQSYAILTYGFDSSSSLKNGAPNDNMNSFSGFYAGKGKLRPPFYNGGNRFNNGARNFGNNTNFGRPAVNYYAGQGNTGFNQGFNNGGSITCQFCTRPGHGAKTYRTLANMQNNNMNHGNNGGCIYCGRRNHTVERCYYIIGVPDQQQDNNNALPGNGNNAMNNGNTAMLAATHNAPQFWLADTGATNHMTSNGQFLNNLTPYSA